MSDELKEYQRRFMALPIIEQRRLINLVKSMVRGEKLTSSVLAGFPEESKAILEEMLRATLPEGEQ